MASCLFRYTAFMHETQLVPEVWWQACLPIILDIKKIGLAYILVKLQGEPIGMLFAALLVELLCLFSIIKSNIRVSKLEFFTEAATEFGMVSFIVLKLISTFDIRERIKQ